MLYEIGCSHAITLTFLCIFRLIYILRIRRMGRGEEDFMVMPTNAKKLKKDLTLPRVTQ